jgi:hypothetical protein
MRQGLSLPVADFGRIAVVSYRMISSTSVNLVRAGTKDSHLQNASKVDSERDSTFRQGETVIFL